MAYVAAIGEPLVIQGFALAGVRVLGVEDAAQARMAWRSLGPDVAVVILTPWVRAALAEPGAAGGTGQPNVAGGPGTAGAATDAAGLYDRAEPGAPLVVVLPP